MRVLNILSYVIGYDFFAKVNSLINYLISASLNRKLRTTKGFAKFQFPVKAVGLENIDIGHNFSSGKNLRIQAINRYLGWNYNPIIQIGDNVTINPNCQIVAINRISIGDNVLIASNVFISDHSHGEVNFADIDISPSLRQLDTKGEIIIGNNVWIGQNVSILSNVKVGRNSIIGANSVVTKDVPEYCVVAGVPARIIKSTKFNV